jgi:very-short-patch-repair endonuclease
MSRKLILEIDGGQHSENEADRQRDVVLAKQGFRILRFWNNDVLKNTDSVLETIAAAMNGEGRPSPGALRAPPSPLRGEGKSARNEACG